MALLGFKLLVAIIFIDVIVVIVVNGQLGQLELFPSFANVSQLTTYGPTSTIDPNSITMSGFASGAFMSMQFHFAHSTIIKGVGMFAGGPYAQNYDYPLILTNGITGQINLITSLAYPYRKTIPELIAQARSFETMGIGVIDSLSNINGSKVYLYQGLLDPVIQFPQQNRTKEMYEAFGANVKKVVLFGNATHGIPTDNYGGPCEIPDPPTQGIDNCGYEGIFDMFSQLYSDFIIPSSSTNPPLAELHVFDQSPFVPPEYQNDTSRAFMARNGYIYIPPGCQVQTNTCKLHFALNACVQGNFDDYEFFPNLFALKTGYLQAADVNKIVVVFPQAAPHYADINNTNSFSCWDFFGGTTHDFPFKSAPHIRTVYNMLAELTGLPPNQ